MKKRNEIDIFDLKKVNLDSLVNLLRQGKNAPHVKAIKGEKLTNAYKAAIKASEYHPDSLKRDRSLGARVYKQIFYYYCSEYDLCSFKVAARFFDQDRVTCYRGWQVVKRMIETKDNFYLPAIEKFKHCLSMFDSSYEKLILAIKFDAFSMSDEAFIDKYSILLF